ncbi:hypothetical protein I7I51_00617 [Histoplasma capsulatum]|uniref:Uncharacterized protein n=1 Tax=Ajellomyces capsulatus TaxID=5037 RepID=A0A8A1MC94_AJECA|nr:hypothetical protein I7I51_00617 [Histoplasma capsulatum]
MGTKLLRSRTSRASARCDTQQGAIQRFGKSRKAGTGAGLSDAKDVVSSKKRKIGDSQVEISSRNEHENSLDDEPIARAPKVARLRNSSTLLPTPHSSSSSCITTGSTSPLTPTRRFRSPSPSPSTTDNRRFQQPTLSNTNINPDEILDNDDDNWPQSFYDLTNLHSSFLTALSLNYAHNGRNTSTDLNQLLPCIEKIWKKRKVERKDLQRLLYILESDLEISDREKGSNTDSGPHLTKLS